MDTIILPASENSGKARTKPLGLVALAASAFLAFIFAGKTSWEFSLGFTAGRVLISFTLAIPLYVALRIFSRKPVKNGLIATANILAWLASGFLILLLILSFTVPSLIASLGTSAKSVASAPRSPTIAPPRTGQAALSGAHLSALVSVDTFIVNGAIEGKVQNGNADVDVTAVTFEVLPSDESNPFNKYIQRFVTVTIYAGANSTSEHFRFQLNPRGNESPQLRLVGAFGLAAEK